jgi:hypothetical protein
MSILDAIYAQELANGQMLAQVLAILNEVPATNVIAGAKITLIEGVNMATKKAVKNATVGDFQLLDNGTATGTISFVDSVGEPAVLQSGATVSTTLAVSDPDLTATIDSTGLVISIAVSLQGTPTLPISDITVTATINISNPDGTAVGPLTAVSQGIDLVAGGPAGASISLS